MILLYTVFLSLLGGLRALVQRRANRLGQRYSALAQRVQQTLAIVGMKPGNASKADPCTLAKAQFELGSLVQARDTLEAKHDAWQHRADRLRHWTSQLRNWKGKTLPYTFGVADVWLALTLIDQLGVGDVLSTRQVFMTVLSLFQSP